MHEIEHDSEKKTHRFVTEDGRVTERLKHLKRLARQLIEEHEKFLVELAKAEEAAKAEIEAKEAEKVAAEKNGEDEAAETEATKEDGQDETAAAKCSENEESVDTDGEIA